MNSNVILIGMPASGKSTCGVVAAKMLLKNFYDTDLLIQNKEGRRLQEIIDTDGVDYFINAEENAILSLSLEGTVIATGGSVIYSDRSMEHLSKMGKIIYLHLDYENMTDRINNPEARGVAIRNGKTLRDMYDERLPLYRKWADAEIDCNCSTVEGTAAAISKLAR